MILATVLAAAKPWTHWMAPPLLVAEIAYLLGIGIRYYRKVQVPWYLWKLRKQLDQHERVRSRHPSASTGLPAAGRS